MPELNRAIADHRADILCPSVVVSNWRRKA
jgi:hypothetical protein